MYYFIPQHNIEETCAISGFCRGVRSSLFWDVTHRRLEVSYWRFGTISRSHCQGSR